MVDFILGRIKENTKPQVTNLRQIMACITPNPVLFVAPWFEYFQLIVLFAICSFVRPMFSICNVGDYGLQSCKTVETLKRATTAEITTISPILYIHCWV